MNISYIKNKLLTGGIWSFALNIVNQVLLLLTTIFLTRLLGVEEFGLYCVILSFMLLCALPFGGGFGIFVIRHISKYLTEKKISHFSGFILTSALWVILGSFIFVGILHYLLPFFISSNLSAYHAGLGLIVLIPTLLFIGAIMRGMHNVIWGRLGEFFIQPVIFILLLSISLFGGLFFVDINSLSAEAFSAGEALSLYVLSYGVAIICSAIFLVFLIRAKIKKHNFKIQKLIFDVTPWIKSAIPLLLSVGIVVVNSNIDVLMVGHLDGESEAGGYRVASRMAGFILFFLFAANNVLGPVISSKHTKGEDKELQKILNISTRLIFLCALGPALLFWIWPDDILSFLFGIEFAVAATALMILTAANIFSVSMGQVGHVMALTGYERYTAYAALIALSVNVILNLWLIPQFGINGAATATGISIIIWNGILSIWTVRKTGYRCFVFSDLLTPKIK